jgi:endo-1,4-beta-xylanase
MSIRHPRRTGLPFGVFVLVLLWLCHAGAGAQQPQNWPPVWNNPPAEPAPGVEHHTFVSAQLQTEVGYNILLPPGYATSERRYPVLYLLHGANGNENRFVPLAPIITRAISDGAVPPLIVVFVNGGARTFYADSPNGLYPAETVVIRELVPHIDATYRTMSDRPHRAISGSSMGGFGALALAMRHADLFSSVVAYAPALVRFDEELENTPAAPQPGQRGAGPSPETRSETYRMAFGSQAEYFRQYSPWHLVPRHAAQLGTMLPIRIIVGSEDRLLGPNQLFHDLLLDHDYDHEFEVVDGVGHDGIRLFGLVGIKGLQFQARAGGWQ